MSRGTLYRIYNLMVCNDDVFVQRINTANALKTVKRLKKSALAGIGTLLKSGVRKKDSCAKYQKKASNPSNASNSNIEKR